MIDFRFLDEKLTSSYIPVGSLLEYLGYVSCNHKAKLSIKKSSTTCRDVLGFSRYIKCELPTPVNLKSKSSMIQLNRENKVTTGIIRGALDATK